MCKVQKWKPTWKLSAVEEEWEIPLEMMEEPRSIFFVCEITTDCLHNILIFYTLFYLIAFGFIWLLIIIERLLVHTSILRLNFLPAFLNLCCKCVRKHYSPFERADLFLSLFSFWNYVRRLWNCYIAIQIQVWSKHTPLVGLEMVEVDAGRVFDAKVSNWYFWCSSFNSLLIVLLSQALLCFHCFSRNA